MENSQYEVLENKNGDCVVKDKQYNKFYFQKKFFASKKYEFENKRKICWEWKDNLLLVGIGLSLISIINVFCNYYVIYNSEIRFGRLEYIESMIFVVLNVVLHEMAHYYVLKFYGRNVGKIRLKFYLKIFPCIVTNTSDSYMLPSYRRGFVYYAGIMINWIICGLILTFFPEKAFLLRCIVWMTIYNMIPFGGIKTDGYHIIVNTFLGVRDFKYKKNIISEIAKYAFLIFAVISFYQSFVIMLEK